MNLWLLGAKPLILIEWHRQGRCVVPVAGQKVYESCDVCKGKFRPLMMFFDGKRFLCPHCRGTTKLDQLVR